MASKRCTGIKGTLADGSPSLMEVAFGAMLESSHHSRIGQRWTGVSRERALGWRGALWDEKMLVPPSIVPTVERDDQQLL